MKKSSKYLDNISLTPTSVNGYVYTLQSGEIVIAMAGPEGPIVKAKTKLEAKEKFKQLVDLHFSVKKNQFVDNLLKNTDDIIKSAKMQPKISLEYVEA